MSRAMLLTGSGGAAIAVVRIEGELVSGFLRECFDRPASDGVCVYGRIQDGERVLDDAVVLLSGASADLNLHGGVWIIHEILTLLAVRGFQIVDWSPEKTWVCDGGAELEREITGYLPLARSELAVTILLNQRQAWANINNLPGKELEKILRDRALEFLLHPPSVAIVGLPNVGKSTLANQLFGQERSITADIPGTTRDWVGELANIDGLVVKLIDTPGQRITDDVIESRAIAAAESVIHSAELIILVIDPTQDIGAQRKLLEANRSMGVSPMAFVRHGRDARATFSKPLPKCWPEALIVINKSDLANWSGVGIRTIASRGIGMDELRSQIRGHFAVLDIDENQPRCWTPRQREQIQKLLRANLPANG